MYKNLLATLILSFTVLNCSQESGNVKVDNNKIKKSTYNIDVINDDFIEKIIENRNGKLLLINFWATWCVPCVKEFPGLVEIEKKYRKELDFLSISIDMPEDIDSKLIPFLEKHQVGFRVYLAEESRTEQIINLLNRDWNGAIPVTFIYDDDGRNRYFIEGEQNFKFFETKIDSILKI